MAGILQYTDLKTSNIFRILMVNRVRPKHSIFNLSVWGRRPLRKLN